MKPAEVPHVTLPTFRLLAVAWLASAATGLAWMGVVWLVARQHFSLTPLVAAGVVAGAATVVFLALRPWHPRSLTTWPFVWVVGSFLRMAATLGGAFLLYSSTPYRGRTLWLSAMAAYVAVMYCETRVYVNAMSRFHPAPGGFPPPLQNGREQTQSQVPEEGSNLAGASRPVETSAASGAE